jgi:glutathione S-transferase
MVISLTEKKIPVERTARPRLYSCAGSRGLRALWTAEELGLPCDLVLLPFPPRFRAREYLAINPLGTVPALVDGDFTMTESSAIAHYLATRDGYTALAVRPGEADYGAFLDFLHHADATLTFPQTVFLRFTKLEKERGLEAAGEAYGDWFRARLIKVEQRLAERAFLCAGRFTVADIAVGYALLLATWIGLSDHFKPRLQDYLAELTARAGYLSARERERTAAIASD